MKSRITRIAILLAFAISSCEDDDTHFIPAVEGLSLYWDHEVFGDGGRRLRFEFNTTNEFVNEYELVFDYSIEANSITARLVKSIDNGECPYYPMPSIGNDDPGKCNASGGFYIPDAELANGVYIFKIITPYFEVASDLTVTDELISMDIPANDYLVTSISDVYPIPENILFGSVVYEGSDNRLAAEYLFRDLTSLGLTEITLPDYPYRHLSVDGNGEAVERHWEPDNHLIGFLYKVNKDFNTIVALSKEHFYRTDLNIYLYTSNGDQALMNQADGITIVYGE